MWKRQECKILQKDWEVLTLPRNEVERDVEDIENRYPKSTAHGVPANDESGVGGRSDNYERWYRRKRKQPPTVKHAARVCEAASGADSRRAAPRARMLIRHDYASSVIRLRILPGPSSHMKWSEKGRSPARRLCMWIFQSEYVRLLMRSQP